MKKFLKENILYLALVQAIVATLGSIYFSEIAGFAPCILCWYQRICMYPLIVILTVGILEKNKNIYKYVLPFSLLGMGIALFQNLLYYKIIPETAAPCTLGVSCTTKYIEWFGFITIPLLSLAGFSIITAIMLFYRNLNSK